MKSPLKFIQSTLFTGLTIILPLLIIFTVFNWIAAFVIKILSPFTNSLINHTGVSAVEAHVIVVMSFLAVCLLLGYYTKTESGKEAYEKLELKLLMRIPGYKMVKQTLMQFVVSKKAPFSSVALVRLYNNETLMTAFITDEHINGSYTVFVPTGPNPASGNIYHVEKDQLTKVDASVEDTMRSIFGCGAGSSNVLKYKIENDQSELVHKMNADNDVDIKQAS